MSINQIAEKWLESRGISMETAARYGLQSSEKHGGNVLEFPYFVGSERVNTKYRNVAEKSFSQDAGGQKVVWNFNALMDETLKGQPVIITEGEMDALAAIESGFLRVVSVPDGAPNEKIEDMDAKKYSYVEALEKILVDCKEIIIAADGDNAGANLLHDLAIRLGKSRCKWLSYPKGCKDLNDALMRYGQRGVTETINRAQWVYVDGVYAMSELPPMPEVAAESSGLSWLDEHYKIRLGDFSVVTGIPSHGKTSFVNQLVASLVQTHGWNACFASFEQHPTLDHRRNLRRWHIGHNNRWSIPEMQDADAWIDDKFRFMYPSELDDVTLEWVLEKASVAVARANCKVIVIDPWNEMDHMRPNGMSLTDYTGFAIKKLKQFARYHLVHLIIVAHPTKLKKNSEGEYDPPTLYDISDSAHWNNKADIGVVVHRKNPNASIIRVAKSRYHDIIGKPGEVEVKFDWNNARFEPITARYSAMEV